MKTYEKHQIQHYSQPGAIDAYARSTFGVPSTVLERHLQIMTGLRTQGGRISTADKRWLLEQAQAAGHDTKQAARDIARVESIPDPERRAQAYVVASGVPSQEMVRQALNLAKTYGTTWGTALVEDRLTARDEQLKKSGNQYVFADSQRYKQAREEASATRRAIEESLYEHGLVPRDPETLQEAQSRAKAYANSAADRLEAVKDNNSSTRDHIEAAWHADQAFQRLNDAGVSAETMSSVIEDTDTARAAARTIDG